MVSILTQYASLKYPGNEKPVPPTIIKLYFNAALTNSASSSIGHLKQVKGSLWFFTFESGADNNIIQCISSFLITLNV